MCAHRDVAEFGGFAGVWGALNPGLCKDSTNMAIIGGTPRLAKMVAHGFEHLPRIPCHGVASGRARSASPTFIEHHWFTSEGHMRTAPNGTFWHQTAPENEFLRGILYLFFTIPLPFFTNSSNGPHGVRALPSVVTGDVQTLNGFWRVHRSSFQLRSQSKWLSR